MATPCADISDNGRTYSPRKETKMTQPIAVVATITAHPGHRHAVVDALRTAVAAVRLEQGCELYVLHEDMDEPNRLVMIERWSSMADLEAHGRGAALATLGGALKDRADLHVSKLIPVS
jgi:quinol monooxygenase YgiN